MKYPTTQGRSWYLRKDHWRLSPQFNKRTTKATVFHILLVGKGQRSRKKQGATICCWLTCDRGTRCTSGRRHAIVSNLHAYSTTMTRCTRQFIVVLKWHCYSLAFSITITWLLLLDAEAINSFIFQKCVLLWVMDSPRTKIPRQQDIPSSLPLLWLAINVKLS